MSVVLINGSAGLIGIEAVAFFSCLLNRFVNNLISWSLGLRYNDLTNAFKLYKKETINGLKPSLSPHFNLTLELPLKSIVRYFSYVSIPNSWRNRKTGESKLKIREMGSRHFFIYLYCLIEKFFERGDFKKWKAAECDKHANNNSFKDYYRTCVPDSDCLALRMNPYYITYFITLRLIKK
ncbi:hypothetical protein GGD38_005326 [Chitinophagaceae bacterium OAS944]|nr:hypothetical protein [Chitinophagaceae bacterium OAS944]